MCSRYSLTSPPEAVRSYFGTVNRPNLPARYNIAPTQAISIVRLNDAGQREMFQVRWGLLPSWVKDPKQFGTLINARVEGICERPAFRAAIRLHRCLVPADGFYEWTGEKGAKRPFFIRRPDGSPFAFAGLWERWRADDGTDVMSATIVTTDANRTVRPLHDRMPAILLPDRFADWLDIHRVRAETAVAFIEPAPKDYLVAEEISQKINDSKTDEPGVRQSLQGDLF